MLQAREIEGADCAPLLGPAGRINLIRCSPSTFAGARSGAIKGNEQLGWYVLRERSVPLEALDPFLPQIGRKIIVPTVVDLIPETSWCSSLANMLTPSSWKVIRDVTISRARGCEECGSRERLECHELWSYNEGPGVQKLLGFRAVCTDCHETYHLGYASVRDRFAQAFRRLVTLNRIRSDEEAEYRDAIFDKFVRRSDIEWILDLSLLAGQKFGLKPSFEEVAPNVLMGKGRMGEVEVSVVGVSIEEEDRRRGLRFA